jgi:thioredoxin reductase (NADPH)
VFDWDVIVIGGGPAGLTAGLYLARGKVRALLLEAESYGGKIKNLELIENYSGFEKGIEGVRLANEMQAQALRFGLRSEMGQVSGIEVYSSSKCVICQDGQSYTCQAIILASGSRNKKLNVPGEDRLYGKGVFTCAFCDGGQFEGKVVAVCGGGDAGITEALYMTKIASKVILLEAMPALTACALLKDRAAANPKLEIRCGTRVEAIQGGEKVESLDYLEVSSGKKGSLKADGVLVHIGLVPNTGFLPDGVQLAENGQVKTDAQMNTSIPLFWAAGDVRSGSPGQVSTAVGDGAAAAINAIRELQAG